MNGPNGFKGGKQALKTRSLMPMCQSGPAWKTFSQSMKNVQLFGFGGVSHLQGRG